jgi:hypothetical protein
MSFVRMTLFPYSTNEVEIRTIRVVEFVARRGQLAQRS